MFDIAVEFGQKAEPVSQGYLLVTSVGGRPNAKYVTVEPALLDPSRKKPEPVAPSHNRGYSRFLNKELDRPNRPEKGSAMPPRKARSAPEPEPEVEETEEVAKDYTVYADKAPTATMQDFAEWLISEVYEGEVPVDEEGFREGVRLGGTLRMEFQRSDFCKERRAERQAARAAGTEEAEEEEEAPAKATTRRRTAAAAKPTAKRPAGKAAASKSPPRARRGGKATAGAEAPY